MNGYHSELMESISVLNYRLLSPLYITVGMSLKLLCWVGIQLMNAPAHSTAVPAQATPSKVAQPQGASAGPPADDGGIDSDLQARLDNLRKM